MELAAIFKALADENRLRILALLRHGELCVCDIEEVLGIQQSNASRHLSKLKTSGLIVSNKKSQWVHYRFNERMQERYPFLRVIISDEIGKIQTCIDDFERLGPYLAKKDACRV